MNVCIQIFYDFNCDYCSKHWSVANVRPKDSVVCPYCGEINEVEGFITHDGNPVVGATWLYPLRKAIA